MLISEHYSIVTKSGCSSSTPQLYLQTQWSWPQEPIQWLCNRWATLPAPPGSGCSGIPQVWCWGNLQWSSLKRAKSIERAVQNEAMSSWPNSDAVVGLVFALSSVSHLWSLADLSSCFDHGPVLSPWTWPATAVLWLSLVSITRAAWLSLLRGVWLCPCQWDHCLPSSTSALAQGSPSLVALVAPQKFYFLVLSKSHDFVTRNPSTIQFYWPAFKHQLTYMLSRVDFLIWGQNCCRRTVLNSSDSGFEHFLLKPNPGSS